MSRGAPPWLVIARREFLERVRTKWFIIGTILGPIGMVASIIIPALLGRVGTEHVRVAVVDRSHAVGLDAALVAGFTAVGWQAEVVPPDTAPDALLARVAAQQIDGYVDVPPDALDAGTTVYRGGNGSSPVVAATVDQVVGMAVMGVRATQAGLTAAQAKRLFAPVQVSTEQNNGEAAGASGTAAMIVGYAVMMILYMAIVLYGVNVMRSVVQEKTSRVVELLVAVAKPRALMIGKIVGVGAVGLVQIGVWLGMAVLTLHFRAELLGALGLGSGGGASSVPPLHALEIVIILAYFLAGYFFYAAVFAALGAMVSSEQEAQQAATPVSLLLIVPLVSVSLITADPRGGAAQLLTMVPLSSPLLMPMRFLLGGASLGEVLLSLGLLLLATALVAMLAARIYRVGILMYGKRPTVRELLRWMRKA